MAELKTWQQYKCFERRPSSESRNVIDTRWVYKWKKVKDSAGVEHSVIPSRPTVRGFKDTGAADLAAFAGTTSRWGQRLVVAVAAQRGWTLNCMDFEKAFLQGHSYAELAEETGEELRHVNFRLPIRCLASL